MVRDEDREMSKIPFKKGLTSLVKQLIFLLKSNGESLLGFKQLVIRFLF